MISEVSQADEVRQCEGTRKAGDLFLMKTGSEVLILGRLIATVFLDV
jgi:hypothetical protein